MFNLVLASLKLNLPGIWRLLLAKKPLLLHEDSSEPLIFAALIHNTRHFFEYCSEICPDSLAVACRQFQPLHFMLNQKYSGVKQSVVFLVRRLFQEKLSSSSEFGEYQWQYASSFNLFQIWRIEFKIEESKQGSFERT